MAIFGRRQPHAPVILNGLPTPRKSVANIVVPHDRFDAQAATQVAHRPQGKITILRGMAHASPTFLAKPPALFGQEESQAAALARKPHGSVTIVHGGGKPSVSQIKSPIGQQEAQAAALARNRPSGHVAIVRGGGRPSFANITLPNGQVEAHAAVFSRNRPAGKISVIKGGGQPSTARATVPVGQQTALAGALSPKRPRGKVLIVRGGGPRPSPQIITVPSDQATSLAAALAPRRPRGQASIISGGRQAAAQIIVRDKASRDAANFAHRPLFQPVIKTLIRYLPFVAPPIGKIIQPNGQAAAVLAAFAERRLKVSVLVLRGGHAPKARLFISGQVSRDASLSARRALYRPVILTLEQYVPVPPIVIVSAVISMSVQFCCVQDVCANFPYVQSQAPQFVYVQSQNTKFPKWW